MDLIICNLYQFPFLAPDYEINPPYASLLYLSSCDSCSVFYLMTLSQFIHLSYFPLNGFLNCFQLCFFFALTYHTVYEHSFGFEISFFTHETGKNEKENITS